MLSFLGRTRRLLGRRAKIGHHSCAALLDAALLGEVLHLGRRHCIERVVAIVQSTRLLGFLQFVFTNGNVAHSSASRVKGLEGCLLDVTLRIERLELVVLLHVVEDARVLCTSPALVVATILRAATRLCLVSSVRVVALGQVLEATVDERRRKLRRLTRHHAFTHAHGLVLRATSLSTFKAAERTGGPLRAREAFFSLALLIVVTQCGKSFLGTLLAALGLRGFLVLDLLSEFEHGIGHA